MEGPQFSTRAESNLYRSWGADVIGMTNLQEAKLAREAEICYATVAMVTDYDLLREGHDAVTNRRDCCGVAPRSRKRFQSGKGRGSRAAGSAHLRLRYGCKVCGAHQRDMILKQQRTS